MSRATTADLRRYGRHCNITESKLKAKESSQDFKYDPDNFQRKA